MKPRFLILLALSVTAVMPAFAAPVFNFNSISLSPNGTDGLNGAANSAAIKAYMNSVPGCAGCVASVAGALATANYSADGNGYQFPSGPRSGQFMTLGTTDGATSFSDLSAADPNSRSPDVFIMNDNFGIYGAASDKITITFTNNLPAGTVVSFDWEIFADASCAPCAPGSTHFPDLEFFAGGVLQGSNPTETASGYGGYFPQGLGSASGPNSFVLTAATNTLQWVDWPAEIGIDNLSIVPPPQKTVPEPSPLALTALALALLALVRLRGRRGGGPESARGVRV